MVSFLSNLIDNLTEEIHKIKCKYEHDNKKTNSKTVSAILNIQVLTIIQ